jgi:hypothetical protein
MSKYIDSEELIEEIKTLRVFVTGLSAGKNVLNEYMGRYRDLVLRVINEQPSVDVVEVVRCKECKYYIDCETYDGKSVHVCSYTRTQKAPNSFCDLGERKID